jgi:HAD superfamily hydrolase (TIGR01484 family)
MKQSYAILVSDFDGTINDGDHTKKNIESLQAFIKDPHHLFIMATGRDYNFVKNWLAENELSCSYIISSNGGSVFQGDGKLLKESPLDEKVFPTLLQISNGSEIRDFAYLKKEQFQKVLALGVTQACYLLTATTDQNAFFQKISQLLPTCFVFQEGDILVVTHKDATKEVSLAFLQPYLPANSTIYTIGDSHNDIKMLEQFNGVLVRDHFSKPTLLPRVLSLHEYVDQLFKLN